MQGTTCPEEKLRPGAPLKWGFRGGTQRETLRHRPGQGRNQIGKWRLGNVGPAAGGEGKGRSPERETEA
jgi:hypothetical protein